MSIALERVSWFPVYDSPAFVKASADGDVASCSSSIGRNSDCDEGSDDDAEVQSSYKGPLDTMDALEDSLPFRRGISKFYCGKSKSFTSLGDALPSSSSKDLAKPENSYSRKRKSLLGFNMWGKSSRNSQRSNGDIAVSKRPANSSRTAQGLAPSTSSSSGSNSCSNGSRESQQPPICSHDKVYSQISSFAPTKWLSCPARSFSLVDLEGAVSSNPSVKSGEKQRRHL